MLSFQWQIEVPQKTKNRKKWKKSVGSGTINTHCMGLDEGRKNGLMLNDITVSNV